MKSPSTSSIYDTGALVGVIEEAKVPRSAADPANWSKQALWLAADPATWMKQTLRSAADHAIWSKQTPRSAAGPSV